MLTRRMSQPKVRSSRGVRLARGLILATGEAITLVVLIATMLAASSGNDVPLTTVVGVFATVSFVTVGGFLVARLSGHLVGWLLWTSGTFVALSIGTGYLATVGLVIARGSIPDAIWFAWLSNWTGGPGLLLAVGILPLFFPTGRSLTPRWQVVAIVGLAAIAINLVSSVFGPFKPGTYPLGIESPLAIEGPMAIVLANLKSVGQLVFGLVVFPLAVASLVVRYERSTHIERRQLKPFGILAGVVVGALFFALIGNSELPWLVAVGGLALLPVTIAIAVLRYQLYNIDRLVSRTIAYGVVTAIVAGLFISFTLAFQAVLAPITQSNELAVAGSTLLVASSFQPIRRRVQQLIDRRFNRTHSDAEVIVARFAERLRDEVDLDRLRPEILATANSAVEPSSVSLWLRESGLGRPAPQRTMT